MSGWPRFWWSPCLCSPRHPVTECGRCVEARSGRAPAGWSCRGLDGSSRTHDLSERADRNAGPPRFVDGRDRARRPDARLRTGRSASWRHVGSTRRRSACHERARTCACTSIAAPSAISRWASSSRVRSSSAASESGCSASVHESGTDTGHATSSAHPEKSPSGPGRDRCSTPYATNQPAANWNWNPSRRTLAGIR